MANIPEALKARQIDDPIARKNFEEKIARQTAYRKELEGQMVEKAAAKTAVKNAEINIPQPSLQTSAAPDFLQAATEQILEEHGRKQAKTEAYAQFLQRQIQRVRMETRRITWGMPASCEDEAVIADSKTESEGVWGDPANPFDSVLPSESCENIPEPSPSESSGRPAQSVSSGVWEKPVNPFDSLGDLTSNATTSVEGLPAELAANALGSSLPVIGECSIRDQRLTPTNSTASATISKCLGSNSGQRIADDDEITSPGFHECITSDNVTESASDFQGIAADQLHAPVTANILLTRIVTRALYLYAAAAINVLDCKGEFSPGQRSNWPSSSAGAMAAGCVQDTWWAADTGAVPVDVSVEHCLVRSIRSHRREMDLAVVDHLVKNLRLGSCLRVLMRYVLMLEPRLTEPFVIEVLERYADPGKANDSAVLPSGLCAAVNMLFHAVANHPTCPHEEAFFTALSFSVADSLALGAGPVNFLEAVRVDIKVQPPLSLLFPADVMLQYTKLFQLLALIQYALHGLKLAWFVNSRLYMGGSCLGCSLPPWVLTLRFRLHFALSILQRFFLVDVLVAEVAILEKRVCGASSVTEIFGAHHSFLETCSAKAFLEDGAEDALSTIVGLACQAVRLRRAVDSVALEVEASAKARGGVPGVFGGRAAASKVPERTLQDFRIVDANFCELLKKLKSTLCGVSETTEDNSTCCDESGGGIDDWLGTWVSRCMQ